MSAVYLNELGVICALGADRAQIAQALFQPQLAGSALSDTVIPGRSLVVGAVQAALPSLQDLPVALHGRNNALLLAALQQIEPAARAAIARYGSEIVPPGRIPAHIDRRFRWPV